jgi:hypothetical protein
MLKKQIPHGETCGIFSVIHIVRGSCPYPVAVKMFLRSSFGLPSVILHCSILLDNSTFCGQIGRIIGGSDGDLIAVRTSICGRSGLQKTAVGFECRFFKGKRMLSAAGHRSSPTEAGGVARSMKHYGAPGRALQLSMPSKRHERNVFGCNGSVRCLPTTNKRDRFPC